MLIIINFFFLLLITISYHITFINFTPHLSLKKNLFFHRSNEYQTNTITSRFLNISQTISNFSKQSIFPLTSPFINRNACPGVKISGMKA